MVEDPNSSPIAWSLSPATAGFAFEMARRQVSCQIRLPSVMKVYPVLSAAIFLALAVCLGAFGAHGLQSRLDTYSLSVYERAVFYHFIHALGMVAVPLLVRAGLISKSAGKWTGWLLLTGIVLFSGSLYVLAITGIRTLGAVTPFGGAAFIAAWITLAVCSLCTHAA